MFTICVAGFKGGTGKTTTATTLAYMLSKERYKSVLLVDADGQVVIPTKTGSVYTLRT